MAVEIYMEPELEEMVGSEEANEEWTALVEELGMEGQKKLCGNDKREGKPSPYMFMNSTMEKMFAIVCPVSVDYRNYDKSTIPREILKEIALSEKEKYFDKIKIWYDDVEKDPVVVGYIKTGEYSNTRHLIGRFGDEVIPFEEIMIKAKKRLKEIVQQEMESFKPDLEKFEKRFFSSSNDYFSITISPVPYGHRSI